MNASGIGSTLPHSILPVKKRIGNDTLFEETGWSHPSARIVPRSIDFNKGNVAFLDSLQENCAECMAMKIDAVYAFNIKRSWAR